MSSNSCRPNFRQTERFVEFLEKNPGLAKGLVKSAQGRQESKRKWASLAITLNSMGGAIKDGPGWSKFWSEKKCYLKKVTAREALSVRRTGGGPGDEIPKLSELEQRLVAVLGGKQFATGDVHLAIDPFPAMNAQRDTAAIARHDSYHPIADSHDTIYHPIEDMPIDLIQDDYNMEQMMVVIEEEGESPASTEAAAPPASPQSPQPERRRPSNRRTQLDEEVARMTSMEDKRIEAELLTARALSGIGDVATAMREVAVELRGVSAAIRNGAESIANALLEIAKKN